jgi:hypothetical protein
MSQILLYAEHKNGEFSKIKYTDTIPACFTSAQTTWKPLDNVSVGNVDGQDSLSGPPVVGSKPASQEPRTNDISDDLHRGFFAKLLKRNNLTAYLIDTSLKGEPPIQISIISTKENNSVKKKPQGVIIPDYYIMKFYVMKEKKKENHMVKVSNQYIITDSVEKDVTLRTFSEDTYTFVGKTVVPYLSQDQSNELMNAKLEPIEKISRITNNKKYVLTTMTKTATESTGTPTSVEVYITKVSKKKDAKKSGEVQQSVEPTYELSFILKKDADKKFGSLQNNGDLEDTNKVTIDKDLKVIEGKGYEGYSLSMSEYEKNIKQKYILDTNGQVQRFGNDDSINGGNSKAKITRKTKPSHKKAPRRTRRNNP